MSSTQYPNLKYQLLSENAKHPVRGTEGSSGLDVFSTNDYLVKPNSDVLIPLDIRFEIPFGWDLSVYNKSGVSTKKKLTKGAELIDSDYRGTVHVHLFNNSSTESINIVKGEKIAQLVMRQVWMGDLEQSENISIDTTRSVDGFGSTGTL